MSVGVAGGPDDGGVNGRGGVPQGHGTGAWVTWALGGALTLIGGAVLVWLFTSGSPAPVKEVAPEAPKAGRWAIPKLETPEPPKPAAAKAPAVLSVSPTSIGLERTEVQITIQGVDLEDTKSIALPGSGVGFQEPEVAADGKRVTVRALVPPSVIPGSYKLVVRTAKGEAKGAAADADKVVVDNKKPDLIPTMPPKREPEKTTAVGAGKEPPPPAKPPVDPLVTRRLTSPIGSAGGGGDAAAGAKGASEGGESGAAGAGGVDLSRTKIGVSKGRRLADLTLTIPAGTMIDCVLDNRIQTDQPGFVSCSVAQDVYGADGTVALIDRGSQIVGEYKNQSITYGKDRVFVVWSRVRTPTGVVVEIDSPGTGPLGEAGFGGYVDNHYFERVGIPVLMSVVTFGIQTAVATAANTAVNGGGGGGGGGNTGSNAGYTQIGQSANTSLQGIMAEIAKIKPTLYVNQGGLVEVLVMKDLEMGGAYQLTRAGE